jgi:class 3 adenylate cyclase
LAEDSTDTGELVVPERSPIEFHHLASSYDEMRIRIEEQRVDLARARDDRLGLLRRMLPASIAERVASGDIEQLDEVPSATVAVVVVHGLGELVRDGGISNRALVDRLHEELDELGDAHGLDRIKVVGDTYFAACGHDRPYIDHAPRVVTFASDARDAIRSLGAESATPIDVAIGVHTGTVTVGMAGGDRLVYDVWGDTVTIADHLARRAGRGEVLMSDATHEMLPTELVCEPSERTNGATAWSLPETATGGLR